MLLGYGSPHSKAPVDRLATTDSYPAEVNFEALAAILEPAPVPLADRYPEGEALETPFPARTRLRAFLGMCATHASPDDA